MLADTAVAVNPDDERYRDVVGGHAILPLVGRRLPIIADEHVDPEFGTGALKITPGHDPNDFDIGRAHGLEEISRDRRGRADDRGRRRAVRAGSRVGEAQEAVVAALREEGRLRGEEPYEHSVPFSHRSGERIEPLICLQWFCGWTSWRSRRSRSSSATRSGSSRRDYKRVYLDWMRATSGPGASRASSGGGTGCPSGTATRARRPTSPSRRPKRADVRRRASPGRGRARHLVQLGAVALRDPRLAGRDARARGLLSRPTS